MNAVDTNVLVYAKDPRDPRKRAIAVALVRDLDEGLLLWQVACEFLAASRKLSVLYRGSQPHSHGRFDFAPFAGGTLSLYSTSGFDL